MSFRIIDIKVKKKCILVSFFISLILFSSAAFSGQAYLNIKPEVNDMEKDGYRLIGEKYEDKFKSVIGPETLVKVYRQDKKCMALFILPNGCVYAYAYKSGKNPLVAYIDTNNDGNCDKTVEADEEFIINFSAYRLPIELIKSNTIGE